MRVRRGLLTLGVVAGLAATGCDTLDAAQRTVDRAGLVNDLATRLERADELTYTAEYQLPGGVLVTIAKAGAPARVAYTYPGGKFIVLPGATTDCQPVSAGTVCTQAPVASPEPDLPAGFAGALQDRGIVTSSVVIGLLNATALDSDATVEQRDTTIAGQHATCLRVEAVDNAAASTFEACVTTDGVLGSFSGTVNGIRVDLAMTSYRGTVAADAFEPPAGARLVGRVP